MNTVACSTSVSHHALRQQRHMATGMSLKARALGFHLKNARVCTASRDVSQEHSASLVTKGVFTKRRDALATILLGAGAFGLESLPCEASPLDSLIEMRRDNNAKFLVGPIRLSRQRMFTVLALTEGSSPEYEEARTALQKASLDCLEPTSMGLNGYAKFRDVCTYGIVFKSVTKGPAAKHDEESPEYKEITTSIISLVQGLKNLDALLASSAAGIEEAPKQFAANFASTMSALDR
eukprot:394377-Pyramimonas_sp.AAC.1